MCRLLGYVSRRPVTAGGAWDRRGARLHRSGPGALRRVGGRWVERPGAAPQVRTASAAPSVTRVRRPARGPPRWPVCCTSLGDDGPRVAPENTHPFLAERRGVRARRIAPGGRPGRPPRAGVLGRGCAHHRQRALLRAGAAGPGDGTSLPEAVRRVVSLLALRAPRAEPRRAAARRGVADRRARERSQQAASRRRRALPGGRPSAGSPRRLLRPAHPPHGRGRPDRFHRLRADAGGSRCRPTGHHGPAGRPVGRRPSPSTSPRPRTARWTRRRRTSDHERRGGPGRRQALDRRRRHRARDGPAVGRGTAGGPGTAGRLPQCRAEHGRGARRAGAGQPADRRPVRPARRPPGFAALQAACATAAHRSTGSLGRFRRRRHRVRGGAVVRRAREQARRWSAWSTFSPDALDAAVALARRTGRD